MQWIRIESWWVIPIFDFMPHFWSQKKIIFKWKSNWDQLSWRARFLMKILFRPLFSTVSWVKINKFTRALGVRMTPWNRKIRQSFLFSPLLWHKFAWIFIQIFGFDFVWYYNLIIGKSFIRNEINLSIFVAKKREVKYVYFLFAWTANYVVDLMYIVLYTDFTI